MNVGIDIGDTVLHTGRLTLRPWEKSDLYDLYEYAKVDGVGQAAGWKPHGSIEESETILDMFIGEKKTFAIVYGGKVVGSLGIEKYKEARFPEFGDKRGREIGFVLSKDCWGRGLMPEAVREVLRWLFDEVGLDVVFCSHFLWNDRSRRVQEKCGFEHYAFDRIETRIGKVEDGDVRILTRERWLAANGRPLN